MAPHKTACAGGTTATRNAVYTRERILTAARRLFSEQSYENVGTRDIAALAGVDAALVSRYFGGKEKLFDAVVEGRFKLKEHIPEDLAALGAYLAEHILEKNTNEQEFDALRVLLRAAGNPAIASIVSARFQAEFVLPLAKLLGGRDAELRATMIAAYIIGLGTMRHGLDSPKLSGTTRKRAIGFTAAAIQACVDRPSDAASPNSPIQRKTQ